jgi:hypothetical protein
VVDLSGIDVHGTSITVGIIKMFAALELERYVKATSVSSDVHLPNVSSDKELAVKVVCTRRIMALTRIEVSIPVDSR